MSIIFSCSGLIEGMEVLHHGASGPELKPGDSPPDVVELRLESFGAPARGPAAGLPAAERPHLVALLSDGTVLLYRAAAGPRGLRFVRCKLDLALHGEPAEPAPADEEPTFAPARIVRFDGVGGDVGRPASGLFVCGARPVWLLAGRGGLAAHPLEVHGAVAAFTPFNSTDCPQGFISAGAGPQGTVNICHLPAHVRLDGPWPAQKLPQRGTPHHIAYYPEARLYALVVSRLVPYKEWLPQEHPGDPAAAAAYSTAEAAAKAQGTHMCAELRLVSPGGWRTVARHQLAPAETATALRALHLTNSRTRATQPLIAVGTSFAIGEDYPCSGRVLLFEVTKDEAPPGGAMSGQDRWKAVMLFVREFTGPVTALSALEGLLVMAAGSRLEVHSWNGTRLERKAFFNASFFITSLKVVKSFILAGDAHNGTLFVRYHENQLTQLSKDFDAADVTAAEFLISGGSLLMLAADASGALRLFSYDQKSPASARGTRLLPLAAFHTGTLATCFLRHRLPLPDATVRQAALAGTLDGSLIAVAALWDTAMYEVLARVQQALAMEMEHVAALNPTAFRRRFTKVPAALGGGRRYGKPIKSSAIVDGDLVWQFQHLPRSRQAAVAAVSGSTAAIVLQHIRDLASALSLF